MKTKKLIKYAKLCASSHSFEGCPKCAYSGGPSCSEKLTYDLTDMLEKLHKKCKAREVVDMIHPHHDTVDYGKCPKCGKDVDSKMKYCSECGQHLNWKVKE